MAETFVDTARFRGTCYRAANWAYLGETAGRSKRALGGGVLAHLGGDALDGVRALQHRQRDGELRQRGLKPHARMEAEVPAHPDARGVGQLVQCLAPE
jgi:hypothetical protein